jgi:hypothetical protein
MIQCVLQKKAFFYANDCSNKCVAINYWQLWIHGFCIKQWWVWFSAREKIPVFLVHKHIGTPEYLQSFGCQLRGKKSRNFHTMWTISGPFRMPPGFHVRLDMWDSLGWMM